MAIRLNDNLYINAGKPVNAKYLNEFNISYANISEVNTRISMAERYIGLTVNIDGDEYWYKEGVEDTDLEPKSPEVALNIITGATNTDDVGGVPIFSGVTNNDTTLLFRTIRSTTPNIINVDEDGDYVSISLTGNFLTGATNALEVDNGVVTLGGEMCKDTSIESGGNYSLCFNEINELCLNASTGVLGGTAFEYDIDYFDSPANYGPRSIPDVNFVTGSTATGAVVKNVCNTTVCLYCMTATDYYIGVCPGFNVWLPENPVNGRMVAVADVSGAVVPDPINDPDTICRIRINTAAGDAFFGGDTDVCIEHNFGMYTFIYNAEFDSWGVTAFNPTVD